MTPPDPTAPTGKIFGIGLNKTGTRSIAAALRTLGFRVMHKGDRKLSDLVEESAAAREPLLARIGPRFDAYFDIDAIVHRFAELDEQYPDSRFLLTTRDLDAWLDSREQHVLANQARAARGDYAGAWLEVDRDRWAAEWAAHHAAVEQHFAGRDDLLVFDVAAGDGWDRLAPFVGRAVPSEPFPWENRAGAGTYRPGAGRLESTARRLRWFVRRTGTGR